MKLKTLRNGKSRQMKEDIQKSSEELDGMDREIKRIKKLYAIENE